MADLYHLYLEAPGLSPDDGVLEKKLDLAVDWFRYASNCWLLYSTSSPAKWYERLGPFVRERKGNVLIVRVDPLHRQGWMSKQLWQWIRDKTQKT